MWLNKEKNISQVSEFSILAYTQNRKLRILGKFYLLKFLVVYENQNQKNELKEKTFTLRCGLRKKSQFPRFPSFRFCLILEIENLENSESFGTELPTFRSSQRRCSIKKLFLKRSQYSQKSTSFGVFFLISCQSFKRENATKVSSYEYYNIFKKTYFQEHVRTAFSVLQNTEKKIL